MSFFISVEPKPPSALSPFRALQSLSYSSLEIDETIISWRRAGTICPIASPCLITKSCPNERRSGSNFPQKNTCPWYPSSTIPYSDWMDFLTKVLLLGETLNHHPGGQKARNPNGIITYCPSRTTRSFLSGKQARTSQPVAVASPLVGRKRASSFMSSRRAKEYSGVSSPRTSAIALKLGNPSKLP